MLVWTRWASSVIYCRAYNGTQTGSEHGSNHAKLKTFALEHLRLDLQNRFEGLQLGEDASPEDEWREQTLPRHN